MSDQLIIQLPGATDPDADLAWAQVRDGAIIAEGVIGGDGHPGLPEPVVTERAIVVLPAQDVFIRRAPVPGQSERDARRAAPFLLEDHLGQALEDLTVEIGPAGADGMRWIMAVDQTLCAQWRSRLSSLNLQMVDLIPDAMLLKGYGGDLTVMEVGDRILFQTRLGDLTEDEMQTDEPRELEAALSDPVCGAIEPDLLNPVLAGLGHRLHPRRLLVSEAISPSPVAVGDAPLAVKRMGAPDLRLMAAALPAERLAGLPALLGSGFGPGLDYGALLKPWRLAAGLGLAAVLGVSALSAGQAFYLDQRTEQYDQARLEAFTQRFPNTRVTNVRAQMNQALEAVQGGSQTGAGFLPLASALADILEDQERVRVDAVRYDASRGALSVTALYSGFGDFEALRSAAQARGIVLEDGGARQSAQGVAAEFTVRLP